MGLNPKDEGVVSHVLDLAVGAIAAAAAWMLYEWTGQAVWSLLLLVATVFAMVWWRTRDSRELPPSE